MSEIRTLVADDEPAARRGLCRLLEREPGIAVVGEAAHGREAVERILALRPDAVFLDIQMPELNGFEVIETLGADVPPAVVFVTAYDAWAVRAFEVQALDYILKPYDDERLRAVLRRLRAHLARRDDDIVRRVRALLAERPAAPVWLTRLLVREGGIVHFVGVDEVEWIEAADYYARLHLDGRTQLVRHSLNELERQLDPGVFVRVHRSALVRVPAVREIRIAWQGHHEIVLRSGAVVPLSRARRERLEEALTRSR